MHCILFHIIISEEGCSKQLLLPWNWAAQSARAIDSRWIYMVHPFVEISWKDKHWMVKRHAHSGRNFPGTWFSLQFDTCWYQQHFQGLYKCDVITIHRKSDLAKLLLKLNETNFGWQWFSARKMKFGLYTLLNFYEQECHSKWCLSRAMFCELVNNPPHSDVWRKKKLSGKRCGSINADEIFYEKSLSWSHPYIISNVNQAWPLSTTFLAKPKE